MDVMCLSLTLTQSEERSRVARRISGDTSIFTYTRSFDRAVSRIQEHPHDVITIDGGPHTLWWYVVVVVFVIVFVLNLCIIGL